jgi:hypothetical protein
VVVLPNDVQGGTEKQLRSVGQSVMNSKSIVGTFFTVLLIVVPSVLAGAQTSATGGPSLPPRGSEKYWLVVDELADHAIHFANAQRFVQLHERPLTDRQCQQYSRIAAEYADQLAAVKQAGISAQSGFWNDVREYSVGMIGAPGVPIPVHRTSNYWVTTGSEAEDRELRRIVSLEIDEASSQSVHSGEYSPSVLNPECRDGSQERNAKAQP